MSDHSDNKCVVCGDRAAGYNFNVLTCASCKAFFRRNALKVKQMKCPFNEKCDLNAVTRKFCSKCRLIKCFEVGMRKELILSEEEKQIRKNRSLEKRKNAKLNKDSSDGQRLVVDSTTTHESSGSSDIDLKTGDQFIDEILNDNSLNDEDIELQVKELEESITDEKEDQISAEVYRKCLELDFAVMPVLRPLNDYNNNFNEMEGNRLTELMSALTIMKRSFGEVNGRANNWDDAMYVIADDFEVLIEKLVQSSKKLMFFKELCNDDQIALVKYGAIDVCCMRQIVGYDSHTQSLIVPGENPSEFILVNLKAIRQKTSYLYEATKNFYQKFVKEWDSDQNILDLMTAIVFFNPDRPKLSHREAIRYEQYVYMYLLKRYLQLKYGTGCVATTKFLRLINTMKYLNNVYLKHIQVYEESIKRRASGEEPLCDSEDCGILTEIYNVNQFQES